MITRKPASRVPSFQLRPVTRAVLGAFLAGATASVHALPTGAEVSAGSGQVNQNGRTLTVEQSSPRLSINWQTFDIGTGESVVFRQPSAQAIALNRVLGQDPSTILGNLSANGQVFLLNPNGVLIGRGAQVDVGGIVASTLGLSDADFLAGRYTFAGTGNAGSVVNQGTIRARDGGYVALVGPRVANEGIITARLGTVALGAGEQVTLKIDGQQLVGFSVDRAAVDALAANKQLIQADGGTVIMSAQAKDALLSTVVNNEGIVEARSVSVENGVIRLDGGASGVVAVSGKLDASGANPGERGGTVQLTGDKIGVMEAAVVDASGHAGGGTVLVGGDYQGANPNVQNASAVYVAPTGVIKADAAVSGDGGKIVLWSNQYTGFHGSLSARGGVASGNGGLVETSSKENLQALGAVDAAAPNGAAGQWLLDPNNITIQTAGANTNVTAGPNFTTTNDSAIVTTGSIVSALNAGTSVTVTSASAGTNSQAGNIVVANAIGKTAGGAATLTLNASNNITFNAGSNVTSTTGALNLTLNAPGAVNTLQNVSLNGGTLTLNATGNVTQAGTIQGNTTVVKNGAGTLTLSGNNTYTGTTAINAGTLRLGAANRIANTSAVTVASGATFNLNNFAETVGSIAGAGHITLGSATLTAGGNNASTTFSGVASGTGRLTKAGTGTLTLSGANTYTGVTTVSGGRLALSGGAAIANTGAVNLSAAGANLTLNASETIGSLAGVAGTTVALGGNTLTTGGNNGTTAYAGVINGTGGLTKAGTGTMTLSGANTYTGTTRVNAGTLALGANNVLANGSSVVVNGGTLSMTTRSDTVAGVQLISGSITGTTGVLTSTSAFDVRSGTVSAILGGTVGLNKSTSGTLTLSGNNTYTGTTAINAGTLRLGAANRISNTGAVTVASGATFNLNNFAETVGSIAGAGNITLGSATLTTGGNNGTTTYAGVMGGTGGLTKAGTGTLTLSGANTYTGPTTINAGTLAANNNSALGAAAGTTTVNAAGTLNIATGVTIAEPLVLNGGTLSATGTAVHSGTVALPASSIASVGAGSSLALNGAVNGPGALNIGGAGSVTFGSTVGNTTRLASLTTAAGSSLTVNGGLVRTTGAQTYNGGLRLGGAANLSTSGGDIIATAPVDGTAGALTLSAGTGNVSLTNAGNDFSTVSVLSGNSVSLADANALTIGASSVGTLSARTLSGNLTLGGNVTATGAGDSIVLAAAADFLNPTSRTLTAGGRWLVYSTTPATDNFGGLASGNQALWNRSYPAAVPETGNRYVFSTQPTLTFTSTNVGKTYGQDATAAVAGAYAVSGLVDAATYGGVFTQDTVTNTVSGTPGVTSLGAPGTAPVAGSPYAINVDASGVTTTTGYARAAASTGQLTVNAAPLTITADNQSKVYGDADPVLTATYAGLQNGETAAVVTGLALSAPTGAAANVIGSPHTIAASGASSANYTISYVDGQLTVSPRPITVAANPQTKVYGDADPALTYAVGGGGLVYGDTLAGVLARAAGDTVAGAPYAILQGTVTNAANPDYAISYSGNVLNITPAALTGSITAAEKVYDGSIAATITGRTLTGVIGADAVSYVGGTASFDDMNVGTGKTVTATELMLAGADAGNYTVNSSATTTADITPRPIAITADSGQTKVYGNGDPLPFIYTITSGNLVGGDSFSGALARTAGENVGSYALTQNTLSAGGNYNLSFVSSPFAITPAMLTYVADPVSIVQATPLPPFAGTVTGLRGGDTLASATTGALAFGTTAPNSNTVGTYAVNGSGLTANLGNYVFTQAPANATALVIEPSGNPVVPAIPAEAYAGALASAAQNESPCAELRTGQQDETLCGAQQNFRQSEQVNLVPGFRRVIELDNVSLTVEGSGMRLPPSAHVR